MHRHIRAPDDINRLGTGAYSPTPRDHAQHARDALLQMLSRLPDEETYSVLARLAADRRMVDRQGWLQILLDGRAAQDAELAPWVPEDVPEFEALHETPPRSGADLFRIAMSRLDDLRDQVERADFSIRGELTGSEEESALQVWVANKLQQAARARYEVAREPEADLLKRPDIRLFAPGIPPTTIEIKWAQSWTYTDLMEALVDQLVGQYMRADNSLYGVLLLAQGLTREGGRRRGWQPPTGPELDFPGLIAALRIEAEAILAARADIEGLAVVGLDFLEGARLTTGWVRTSRVRN